MMQWGSGDLDRVAGPVWTFVETNRDGDADMERIYQAGLPALTAHEADRQQEHTLVRTGQNEHGIQDGRGTQGGAQQRSVDVDTRGRGWCDVDVSESACALPWPVTRQFLCRLRCGGCAVYARM